MIRVERSGSGNWIGCICVVVRVVGIGMVVVLMKVGVVGYGCGKDNKVSYSEGEIKGVER